MIVFGIHCNFVIVLSVWLEICRSNEFFFFTKQNMRAQKIEGPSEVLHSRARPIGIGRAICPGLMPVYCRKIYWKTFIITENTIKHWNKNKKNENVILTYSILYKNLKRQLSMVSHSRNPQPIFFHCRSSLRRCLFLIYLKKIWRDIVEVVVCRCCSK